MVVAVVRWSRGSLAVEPSKQFLQVGHGERVSALAAVSRGRSEGEKGVGWSALAE